MKLEANVRNIILWVVKLGTLAFSFPATWSVAGTILPAGTPWYWDLVVRISAISILDGVFLVSWTSLDSLKDEMEDKIVEVIIVILTYGLIVAISVVHGEGFRGILFRAPVGLALGRSVWRTLSYTIRRWNSQVERGTKMSRRARKAKRLADEAMQIATIEHEKTLHVQGISATERVQLAHLNARSDVGIQVIEEVLPVYHDQALSAAKNLGLPELTVGIPTPVTIAAEEKQVRQPVKPKEKPEKKKQVRQPSGTIDVYGDSSVSAIVEDGEGGYIGVCLAKGCENNIFEGCKTEVEASYRLRGHRKAHTNGGTVEYISLEEALGIPPEDIEEAPQAF